MIILFSYLRVLDFIKLYLDVEYLYLLFLMVIELVLKVDIIKIIV